MINKVYISTQLIAINALYIFLISHDVYNKYKTIFINKQCRFYLIVKPTCLVPDECITVYNIIQVCKQCFLRYIQRLRMYEQIEYYHEIDSEKDKLKHHNNACSLCVYKQLLRYNFIYIII